MARRDALLRLHKQLSARRDELRRRIGSEITDLLRASDSGDAADQAFDNGSEDVISHLAEIESRELAQIGRALDKLKTGTYGTCEGCQKKIPLERLNALPYSTTCVSCQREMELYGSWQGSGASGMGWERVNDSHRPLEDQRELSMSDIEMDMPTR